MTKHEMVCINCPKGCTLTVTEDNGTITVEGNTCKRGEQFAVNELTQPMRTICSTVATAFPDASVIPCRVSGDIPKDQIFNVMKEINKVVVKERIHRGDPIIKNVLNLGVDVIATSDVLTLNNGEETIL